MKPIRYIEIIFLINLVLIVSNYKVFSSYIDQQTLIWELNSGNMRTSLNEIKKMNFIYPSISVTAAPLSSIIGRYYLRDKEYDRAKEMFRKGNKVNPYLMLSNFYMGKLFQELGEKDSAYFYAKKALEFQPNHPNHVMLLVENYKFKGLQDSIFLDSVFDVNKRKSLIDHENYFIAGLNYKIITEKMKKTADSIESFGKSDKFNTLKYSILIGQEEVAVGMELCQTGIEKFNESDYQKSFEKLRQSEKYFPEYPTTMLNLSVIYSQLDSSQLSINYGKKFLESRWDNKSNGKANFLIGLNYARQKELDSACFYLSKSIIYGYKDALRAKNYYCN